MKFAALRGNPKPANPAYSLPSARERAVGKVKILAAFAYIDEMDFKGRPPTLLANLQARLAWKVC